MPFSKRAQYSAGAHDFHKGILADVSRPPPLLRRYCNQLIVTTLQGVAETRRESHPARDATRQPSCARRSIYAARPLRPCHWRRPRRARSSGPRVQRHGQYRRRAMIVRGGPRSSGSRNEGTPGGPQDSSIRSCLAPGAGGPAAEGHRARSHALGPWLNTESILARASTVEVGLGPQR